MRRWVEIWKQAGRELEEIRRRELQAIDTREAVRQLLGGPAVIRDMAPRTTSGLVEPEAWVARLRR
jgi:hypothetical protein